MKSGNLNFLEPSGPLQAFNGTALPFYHGREGKEDVQEKRGRKEYKQPWEQESQKQINGETERNGVWFPEDGDSC